MSNCLKWGKKYINQCVKWADEGINVCQRWADEGSAVCQSWADQGSKKCSGWAKWFCKAWIWVANMVCQVSIWVSNMVCKLVLWVSKWVCALAVITSTPICLIWGFIRFIIFWSLSLIGVFVSIFCSSCNFQTWVDEHFGSEGKIKFIKKETSKSQTGYFDYYFTCPCDKDIIVTATIDDGAAQLAKDECDKVC